MPLKVTDLKPGDRVLLNCPKSRVTAKREAVFEGIFASLSEAQERTGTVHIDLVDDTAFAFLSHGKTWARFLFQRVGPGECVNLRRADGSITALGLAPGCSTDLVGAFLVEPDGSLREEEGRRIFIERRITAGQG